MALNLLFNFGRLLGAGEKLTTARVNAIVRGITASITGLVGKTDLAAGAVDPTIAAPGAYFYTENCVLIGTTYNITGFPIAPTALVPGLILCFKADANNVGPVNLSVNALGAAQISKYGGKLLVAGDIKARQMVTVQYAVDLLAQPTWQIVSLPANRLLTTEVPVLGSARNLVVTNIGTGTPQLLAQVTADEILLKDANGFPYLASAVNVTANISVGGANGLDTGALTAATWYYVWVIYDATNNVTAALFSISPTAPTLPGTYTFKALAGTVHAGIPGGSTTDFMTFYQQDREVWIDDSVVFTNKTGVTVWTSLAGADLTAMQALVPPIAKEASGSMGCSANNNGGMGVAGDASALGASIMTATTLAATTVSYNGAGSWRCPLKTAQTVYYIMAATTANNYRLSVRGYKI